MKVYELLKQLKDAPLNNDVVLRSKGCVEVYVFEVQNHGHISVISPVQKIINPNGKVSEK